MSSVPSLAVSRRNRRTPYTERVEALGVQGYSIVNHMLLSKPLGARPRRTTGTSGSMCSCGTSPASAK